MNEPVDIGFKYFAFISYSHRDEKWAKWIQHAIEHYKLPALIRKESKEPLPKKLSPVFRDATHLGAGKLVNNLHGELEASKFLIVVCSPSAANPNAEGKHFVDFEVRHFCELGRADRIIPIIVAGTPETSFCPKIKEEEILALDATKSPKARILNDIVARLLGLRPDDLWQREKRRLLRGRIIGTVIAVVAAVACLGLGLLYRDRYCDHIEYYADYVNDWGVPKGLGQLSADDIRHRCKHWRFTYKGYDTNGKGDSQRVLRWVSYCDADGRISDNPPDAIWIERPVAQRFYYDSNGLIRKVAYDSNGFELYSLDVTGDGIWSMHSQSRQNRIWTWGSNIAGYDEYMKGVGIHYDIVDLLPEFNVSALVPSFFVSGKDEQGRPTRIDFLPNPFSRKAMSNRFGAYGEQYVYADNGKISKIRFVDKDGLPFSQSGVFAGIDINYSGTTTTVASVDVNGNRLVNPLGWAVKRYAYSSSGNKGEESFLDENLDLIAGPFGFAQLRFEYDDAGRFVTRCARYNADKCLVENETGWATMAIRHKGCVDDLYYFDKEGSEFIVDGYSHKRIERKENCRIESYFRFGGARASHSKTLAHKYVNLVDRNLPDGRYKMIESWYDANNRPCWCKDLFQGSFSNRISIVGAMGLEEMQFLPADRAMCSKVKITRERRFGKLHKSRIVVLNEKGEPAAPKEVHSYTLEEVSREKMFASAMKRLGVQEHVREAKHCNGMDAYFDDMGRVVRYVSLCDGNIVSNALGIAQHEFEYGENGLVSKMLFKSAAGELNERIAAIGLEYDDKGLSRVVGLDKNMRAKINDVMGCARMSVEYDRYGHPEWVRFYKENDELMINDIFGYAVRHSEWTPDGRMTLVEFLDEHKQRMPKDGAYVVKCSYEKKPLCGCNLICECYFDKDGITPVISPRLGCHMFLQQVNARGQVLLMACCDVDGKTLRGDESGRAKTVASYFPSGVA